MIAEVAEEPRFAEKDRSHAPLFLGEPRLLRDLADQPFLPDSVVPVHGVVGRVSISVGTAHPVKLEAVPS